jgi:hypothetical protein
MQEWKTSAKRALERLVDASDYINARIFERTKAYSARQFTFVLMREVTTCHRWGTQRRTETRADYFGLSLADATEWYDEHVPVEKRHGTEFALKRRNRER